MDYTDDLVTTTIWEVSRISHIPATARTATTGRQPRLSSQAMIPGLSPKTWRLTGCLSSRPHARRCPSSRFRCGHLTRAFYTNANLVTIATRTALGRSRTSSIAAKWRLTKERILEFSSCKHLGNAISFLCVLSVDAYSAILHAVSRGLTSTSDGYMVR